MNEKAPENPCTALDRLFHEPSRLAILSALCGAANGMSFNELKAQCDLTDGNLSRHLKTLEDARVVIVRKSFANNKPLTRVAVSDYGREGFLRYLQALEAVLQNAAGALRRESRGFADFFAMDWAAEGALAAE